MKLPTLLVALCACTAIPVRAEPFLLMFDSTGRTSERFTVPASKIVYLVRAPQAQAGTATIVDLNTLATFEIPDGATKCRAGIAPGSDVALTFNARINSNISFVNAEVTSAREGIAGCK
ncbi:UNVERIFIED_ORG: hypothetical protein ABIC54_000758 [Burkholderia sp. 1263]|jgi:hypothetical protein|uniref:hypothetical protein n=1 Tax=Paraburkholderia terricola TaxID=169427 RepID=UPI002856D8A3|nr:hypothetical protein [Paraburkholderia terricola]MDR6450498.1 hypothetical protein [Paraburkholderia terricola]